MSSFDVSRKGELIALMRCEGPFGIPASQWDLTVQDAERIVKILSDAIKSMKKRAETVK